MRLAEQAPGQVLPRNRLGLRGHLAPAHAPFDFVFIDGDHHHQAVLDDWHTYGPLARYVGFHDICGLYDCEGSRTSWEVIRQEAGCLAEIVDPDWPIGIGLVEGKA